MQTINIISAQTTARISSHFDVEFESPVSLVMHGALSEAIAIEILLEDGTFAELTGEGEELTAAENSLQIVGPGRYRCNKGVTVGAVGVEKLSR